ncbi:Stress up-regulated Nod 19 [Sesbania bispinosa]|nr:Stress up-regulated Nod 19 [Sesbania bispinosa]
MCSASRDLVISLAILLVVLSTPCSGAFGKIENNIKSAVFLSPKFELGPGSVVNRYYYDIDFPRGHIALKSFNAEVIDEAGNPVPLHETYLHHWVVGRYYQRKHLRSHTGNDGHHRVLHESDSVFVRNNGICQKDILGQYYGLGSETRGTATDIPDPFGIVVGDPAEIPEGYEEKWMVNVHAIDTRGVEDKLGCTECRCDLYNVTIDEYGRPLKSGYRGGLLCCYDYTQCRLKEDYEGPKRSLYLRYTVKWVDWDNFIVPVKIYILDVTDTLKISDNSKEMNSDHDCKVEYEVESCSKDNKDGNGCLHVKRTSLPMRTGGYVIYGVAHQHSGGTGSTLYGQDGRVICSSIPSYGNGNEAGDEAGYIVGMSTCYPQPGSVKIIDGETLTLESNYSSTQGHTGVMGLFYLLVAEQLPQQHFSHSLRSSFLMDVNNIFN